MVDYAERAIHVNGEEIRLDTKSGLPIADISKDMDNVASQMAWWSSVWAAAECQAEEVDAHYRRWRAQKSLEVVEADPKLAEWKVKSAIEADDQFLRYKLAAAKAQDAIVAARGQVAAYDKKANALQSKGAMMRKELGATGMTTPRSVACAAHEYETTTEEDDVNDDVRGVRVDRVREIFKSKSKKD